MRTKLLMVPLAHSIGLYFSGVPRLRSNEACRYSATSCIINSSSSSSCSCCATCFSCFACSGPSWECSSVSLREQGLCRKAVPFAQQRRPLARLYRQSKQDPPVCVARDCTPIGGARNCCERKIAQDGHSKVGMR